MLSRIVRLCARVAPMSGTVDRRQDHPERETVEATTGFEPVMEVLQTSALGHLATSPGCGRCPRPRRLAAPRGFEPRFTDPKSGVLPLDEGASGPTTVYEVGAEGVERKTGLEPATLTLAR